MATHSSKTSGTESPTGTYGSDSEHSLASDASDPPIVRRLEKLSSKHRPEAARVIFTEIKAKQEELEAKQTKLAVTMFNQKAAEDTIQEWISFETAKVEMAKTQLEIHEFDVSQDVLQFLERVAAKCPKATLAWAESEPALAAFKGTLANEKLYQEEQILELRSFIACLKTERKRCVVDWAKKIYHSVETSIKRKSMQHESQLAEHSNETTAWCSMMRKDIASVKRAAERIVEVAEKELSQERSARNKTEVRLQALIEDQEAARIENQSLKSEANREKRQHKLEMDRVRSEAHKQKTQCQAQIRAVESERDRLTAAVQELEQKLAEVSPRAKDQTHAAVQRVQDMEQRIQIRLAQVSVTLAGAMHIPLPWNEIQAWVIDFRALQCRYTAHGDGGTGIDAEPGRIIVAAAQAEIPTGEDTVAARADLELSIFSTLCTLGRPLAAPATHLYMPQPGGAMPIWAHCFQRILKALESATERDSQSQLGVLALLHLWRMRQMETSQAVPVEDSQVWGLTFQSKGLVRPSTKSTLLAQMFADIQSDLDGSQPLPSLADRFQALCSQDRLKTWQAPDGRLLAFDDGGRILCLFHGTDVYLVREQDVRIRVRKVTTVTIHNVWVPEELRQIVIFQGLDMVGDLARWVCRFSEEYHEQSS